VTWGTGARAAAGSLLAAVVACGGSNAPSAAPSAAAVSPSPQGISVPMQAVAASGVTGSALITKEAGSFTVKLTLTGMKANSQHANHIHKGSCAKAGPIDKALQTISADASGNGAQTSTVPSEFAIPAEGWYVNVHTGADITQPGQGAPISCGDIPAA
jgi:Cu/Zn superoxide dismutase